MRVDVNSFTEAGSHASAKAASAANIRRWPTSSRKLSGASVRILWFLRYNYPAYTRKCWIS